MVNRWILDASPIISLGKIDALSIFELTQHNIKIPSQVVSEILASTSGDPAIRWVSDISEEMVCPAEVLSPIVQKRNLGLGESAVLSCCLDNPSWTAVLDDKVARAVAKELHIRILGTLGIIGVAKQDGLIEEAKPLIEKLIDAGFHIKATEVSKILEMLGETP